MLIFVKIYCMTVARKHRDFWALECLRFQKFRGLAIRWVLIVDKCKNCGQWLRQLYYLLVYYWKYDTNLGIYEVSNCMKDLFLPKKPALQNVVDDSNSLHQQRNKGPKFWKGTCYFHEKVAFMVIIQHARRREKCACAFKFPTNGDVLNDCGKFDCPWNNCFEPSTYSLVPLYLNWMFTTDSLPPIPPPPPPIHPLGILLLHWLKLKLLRCEDHNTWNEQKKFLEMTWSFIVVLHFVVETSAYSGDSVELPKWKKMWHYNRLISPHNTGNPIS